MIPKKEKKEETRLAAQNPGVITKLPQVPVGQENIDPEDIVIPRIRLLQPISKDVVENGAKAGAFMVTITGEILPALDMVFFYHGKSRVLFTRAVDESAGEGITCISNDAKIGGNGKKCSDCPFSMWDDKITPEDKAGGKFGGPECNLIFNYPGLILNSANPDMPVALSLMRTSMKQGRQINSMVKLARLQWWSKIFKVSSELRTGKKGSYYVFKIKDSRPATEEEQTKAFAFYQSIIGKNVVVEQGSEGTEESEQ